VSYLLDTCVLSETVRPRPADIVLNWLQAQEEATLYLSVLTLGELHKGIAKLDEGERRRSLTLWVDGDLARRFERRALPINAAVASSWGEMAGRSERGGRPIPVIDGLIAATARVHGLVVVTRNTDQFVQCGVPVFDPWTAG
jgi:predicted nucleic acid-binding protein